MQAPDNGFVVAGLTTSNDGDVSGFNGYRDIWIVKLSAAAVGIAEYENQFSVQVFPNPAADKLTVKITSPGSGASGMRCQQIELLDLLGKRLIEMKCGNTKEESISIGQLSAGIYLVKVHTGEGELAFKVVKE